MFRLYTIFLKSRNLFGAKFIVITIKLMPSFADLEEWFGYLWGGLTRDFPLKYKSRKNEKFSQAITLISRLEE